MKEPNFQLIETNGIRLRTVVEGNGPLVILLHGFPQCWYLWRHQIAPLVEAGFQVAVPDQRGYGGSDRPASVEAYNIIELTSDVIGLADALRREQFIVVGQNSRRAGRLAYSDLAPAARARGRRPERAVHSRASPDDDTVREFRGQFLVPGLLPAARLGHHCRSFTVAVAVPSTV